MTGTGNYDDEDWAYGDGYYYNNFADLDDEADVGIINMPYPVRLLSHFVAHVCMHMQCARSVCTFWRRALVTKLRCALALATSAKAVLLLMLATKIQVSLIQALSRSV